ncbi:ATP-binding cassette domain-containing protein [Nocardioides sp. NBC_00368]|uniref:ABC transporter ATP-binding protein n=1 Tax=Nocardioides sp. NBC_00368 TaxID=2976000 RepID=UPI002E23C0AD
MNLKATGVVVRTGSLVLADVPDVHIEAGKPLSIVGESGSGKSVLAHALMGTLPPELSAVGALAIGDASFDLAERDSRRTLWGREVALLPQEPALALDPTMRVRAQVAEGVAGWRPRSAGALEAADTRLGQVGLAGAGSSYPHTLSGGMAQRVAYAAATVGGAKVLILDEPSKGLDRASVDQLADLLLAHLDEGGLLLTITHDLRLARRLGGEVMVMREAAVVESGPVEVVLTSPAQDYTKRLLAAEPVHWRHPWMRTGAPDDGDVLVRAEAISKSYAHTAVFDGVDLEVHAGERVAITGPSGAGKTTLGNALLGLTRVDSGSVTYGQGMGRGRMQKLYQDPALSFPQRVSLEKAMGDVMRRHGIEAPQVEAMLERLGLPYEILRRRPGQVSGGELQRIAVVRAMLPRPSLVFADEATSRLDLVTQEQTVDALMSEVSESGAALLLVTHDTDLSAALADREIAL